MTGGGLRPLRDPEEPDEHEFPPPTGSDKPWHQQESLLRRYPRTMNG
ncbi:MAG: hypothetical protein WKF95_01390 [Rubrobacter sp.]